MKDDDSDDDSDDMDWWWKMIMMILMMIDDNNDDNDNDDSDDDVRWDDNRMWSLIDVMMILFLTSTGINILILMILKRDNSYYNYND